MAKKHGTALETSGFLEFRRLLLGVASRVTPDSVNYIDSDSAVSLWPVPCSCRSARFRSRIVSTSPSLFEHKSLCYVTAGPGLADCASLPIRMSPRAFLLHDQSAVVHGRRYIV